MNRITAKFFLLLGIFVSVSIGQTWPISRNTYANADVITSPFGPRQPTPTVYQLHWGLDIRANLRSDVYAIRGGTIRSEPVSSGGIISVRVNHYDGSATTYLHLDTDPTTDPHPRLSNIYDSATVAEGDLIAFSGSSGTTYAHLHVGYYPSSFNTNELTDTKNPLDILAHDELSPYSISAFYWIRNGGLDGSNQIMFDLYVNERRLDVNRIVISIGNTYDIYGFLKNEWDILNSQFYATNIIGRIDFEGRSNVDYNARINDKSIQEFNGVRIEPAYYDNSNQGYAHRYTIKFNVKNSVLTNLVGNIGSVYVTVYNPNGTYSVMSGTAYFPVFWTENWPSSLINIYGFNPPLTVGNRGKIVVQNGGILTGSSEPPNNCPKLYGTMVVESGGTLELLAGPDADHRTWFSIKPGGTLTVNSGGTVSRYSHTVLRICGTYNFSGTYDDHGGTNAELFLNCEGSIANYNVNTNHNANGACILVRDGAILKVAAGKTLTFSNGAFLALRSGGIVDIDNTATLTLESTSANSIIDPGTTVKFGSSAQFICNRAFTAQGTSASPITFTSNSPTPSPGSWYIMFLYGGPNTLQYCNIKYATHGLYVSNTSTTSLNNVTISDCSGIGVFGFNTLKSYGALTIQNSTIQNVGTGIELNNARADLANTIVKNNSYSGIYAYNSYLYLSNSKSQNNGHYGVHVAGTTGWGVFGDQYYNPGYNVVYNNNAIHANNVDEVLLNSGGHAYIGEHLCDGVAPAANPNDGLIRENPLELPPPCYDYAGYNNIYHGPNMSPGQHLIENQTSNTVLAHWTYWGSAYGPTQNDFYGPVDYSYAISYPTNSPSSAAPFSDAAFSTHGASNSNLIGKTAVMADRNKLSALASRMKRDLENNPDRGHYALSVLSSLVGPGSILEGQISTSWEDYLHQVKLKAQTKRGQNILDAFLVDARIRNRDFDNALVLADNVLKEATDDDIWLHAQSSKLTAYLGKKDLANAEMILERIKNSGRQIDSRAVASLEEVINLEKAAASASQLRNGAIATKSQEKTQGAQELLILSNYPNPFNPTTLISFELPEPSIVSLSVYNLLGQEVALVTRSEYPAGKHSVHFDGSKLSSGIYFYKLVAGRYQAVNKFVLLR